MNITRRGWIGAAAAALVANTAWAQEARHVFHLPSRIVAVIPQSALINRVNGTVKLQCAVTEHSAWNDCKVVSESPRGQGFANSALALARTMPPEATALSVSPSSTAVVRFQQFEIETEAGGIRHNIRPPAFARIPDSKQLQGAIAAYLPDPGRRGRAELECIVTIDGHLDPCSVVRESNPGQGFDKAAFAETAFLRMRPLRFDGQSRGDGTILIPFAFGPH